MVRVFDDWRIADWRPNFRKMLIGLEVALVAILAVQGARLVWRLFEPTSPLGGATVSSQGAKPIRLAVFSGFDPFFRVSEGPRAAQSAEAEFQLFGVRADGRGGGSAIVGTPGGAQGSFLVGEEVAPGVLLRAVGLDHAMLSRGGGQIRIQFQSPSLTPPPPPPPPTLAPLQGPTAGAAIDPKAFLAAASLTPRLVNGQVAGYRVMGRGDSNLLTRAGLQDGDVLLAVEGAPFNAERMSELPALLAQSSEVEVRIERAGQSLTTRLKMAPR